ncbi:hypothetical protein ACROYT_G022061 [Oculina patagonica]
MQWSHDTSPRSGQDLYAWAEPITRGVAAMDSCFVLARTHQHGLARRVHGCHSTEPVPGHFNIYVTNKTKGAKDIYVRLRGDKLQESEIYSRILHETSVEVTAGGKAGQGEEEGGKRGIKVANKHGEENKERQVFSCLTQGGFTFLPAGETMPFAVENIDRLMYISVHDGSNSWGWDMQVNPQVYGCVTVKEGEDGRISISPSNPEPYWYQCNRENEACPSGHSMVKVYQKPNSAVVFLAKVCFIDKSSKIILSDLDGTSIENEEICMERFSGLSSVLPHTIDLLLAAKYEWVKAQRGNVIPPNAVKTMVNGDKNKEIYVGRVGGETVSEITIADGMIDYFVYNADCKSTSGEILLLTVDSSV